MVEAADPVYDGVSKALRAAFFDCLVHRLHGWASARRAMAMRDDAVFVLGSPWASRQRLQLVMDARQGGSRARIVLIADDDGENAFDLAIAAGADDVIPSSQLSPATMRRVVMDHLRGKGPRWQFPVAWRGETPRFMEDVVEDLNAICAEDLNFGFSLLRLTLHLDQRFAPPVEDESAVATVIRRSVRSRLERCLRRGDRLSSLSAGDFVVLAAGCVSAQQVDAIAMRLRSRLRGPYVVEGQQFTPALEIGASTSVDGDARYATLLAVASERRLAGPIRRGPVAPR